MFIIVDTKFCLRVFGPHTTLDEAIQSVVDDAMRREPGQTARDRLRIEQSIVIKRNKHGDQASVETRWDKLEIIRLTAKHFSTFPMP